MAREYIPLFLDFNDSTQDLSDEECGRLVRAIVDYANGDDYESRLTGAEKIAFRFLKGAIDRNQAISEARSKARTTENKTEQADTNDNKQEQTTTNENKTEQTESNENKTEQTESKSLNKKLITKNKEENKNNNECIAAGAAHFQRPTVEEVRSYCSERNNSVDAQMFVDFYASKGWRVGNQPMRDWKAAVRTWEKRDGPQPQKKVSAQDYEQRDYSGKAHQNEMPDWMKKAWEKMSGEKKVIAQQYEQRDYSDKAHQEDMPDWLREGLEEMDGGKIVKMKAE